MLNINQKIELKRECINIPQAIKSGYNIVEVSNWCRGFYIPLKYDVIPLSDNIRVQKHYVKNTFWFNVFMTIDGKDLGKLCPEFKNTYVKFIVNMQEYGK